MSARVLPGGAAADGKPQTSPAADAKPRALPPGLTALRTAGGSSSSLSSGGPSPVAARLLPQGSSGSLASSVAGSPRAALPGGGLLGTRSPGGSSGSLRKDVLGRGASTEDLTTIVGRGSSRRLLATKTGPTPVQKMAFGEAASGAGPDTAVSAQQRALRDFRARFDYFLVLLTVLEAFWVPVRVGFDIHHQGYWLVVDVLVDVMFALDMALHFVTPTFIKGILVTDRAEIRADYLSLAYPSFALDLAATLPLDLLLLSVVPHGTRESAMLRSNRLLRINKLVHMFRRYEEAITTNTSVIQLFKCVLGVFFLAHLIGCSWFLISYLEDWPDNGWTPSAEVLARSVTQRYIESLLWAFNGIYHPAYIGSSFPPDTLAEHVFTLLVMLIGIFMFASIVGFTSTLILNLDASAAAYRAKMDSLARYCSSRGVTVELRERIYNYCKYLWSRRNGLNDDLPVDLPDFLRAELAMEINSEILSQVPLFEGCEEAFISALATKLHPMVATPGDVIVQQDSVGTEMYFISQGQVQIVTEKADGVQVAQTTLSAGSFFGEIALLFEKKRTASVVALTYCDLYVLGKEDLDAVFEEFPAYRDIMCRIAELRYHMSTAVSPAAATDLSAMLERAPSSLRDLSSTHSGSLAGSVMGSEAGSEREGSLLSATPSVEEVKGSESAAGSEFGGGDDINDDDDEEEEGVFLSAPVQVGQAGQAGQAGLAAAPPAEAAPPPTVNEVAELKGRVAQLERSMADQRRVYAMQLDSLKQEFQQQIDAMRALSVVKE